MPTRHGGAAEGQGGEQAPAKRRRRRREVTAGGGQQAAVAAWGQVPRYFDCLSEDLIGVVLSFLGVRCLDNACHVCKAVSQAARPLMPLWIGVAASAAAAGGTAASRLPAHVKPTLQEALAAFQRFRMADMGGRGLEIRLVDNAQYATGFCNSVGVRGIIGCEYYGGLELDGNDHWQGLRVVTPEVDVLYDDESCYSVIVKDNVMSIGERAFSFCKRLTSV
eukprot:g1542.t1